MQFTTAALGALFAASAVALPQTTPIPGDAKFGLITIRSGSPIQNSGVQAALTSLLVNLPQQNATSNPDLPLKDAPCPSNYATFYLKDTKLFLYTGPTSYTQTVFVDRSGMGQGRIGYITGAERPGANWELSGWALNSKNELEFDGTGLQACPQSIDGSWSLWLQGDLTPGSNQNCTGVITAAIESKEPIACSYSR